MSLLRSIVCLLFGHVWGPWEPAHLVTITTSGSSEPFWLVNGSRARWCDRGHIESWPQMDHFVMENWR